MDRYEKVKVLGRGAFGVASLAKEKETEEDCVIKEIDLGRLSPSARRDAHTEIEVLAQLSHPHIVGYQAAFLEGFNLYIVMEFADGGDVAGLVLRKREEESRFEEEAALVVLAQCTQALAHIHTRRILHRDIKGQNIFLTSGGMVKLGDFGIAKVLGGTLSAAQTMIGTPHYLAPEVCENKPYGVKADIWSIGVVFHELLALQQPFQAYNIAALVLKVITGEPGPVPEHYSEEARELLRACLSKDPAERPNATALLNMPIVRPQVGRMFEPSMTRAKSSRGTSRRGRTSRNGTPASGARAGTAAGGSPAMSSTATPSAAAGGGGGGEGGVRFWNCEGETSPYAEVANFEASIPPSNSTRRQPLHHGAAEVGGAGQGGADAVDQLLRATTGAASSSSRPSSTTSQRASRLKTAPPVPADAMMEEYRRNQELARLTKLRVQGGGCASGGFLSFGASPLPGVGAGRRRGGFETPPTATPTSTSPGWTSTTAETQQWSGGGSSSSTSGAGLPRHSLLASVGGGLATCGRGGSGAASAPVSRPGSGASIGSSSVASGFGAGGAGAGAAGTARSGFGLGSRPPSGRSVADPFPPERPPGTGLLARISMGAAPVDDSSDRRFGSKKATSPASSITSRQSPASRFGNQYTGSLGGGLGGLAGASPEMHPARLFGEAGAGPPQSPPVRCGDGSRGGHRPRRPGSGGVGGSTAQFDSGGRHHLPGQPEHSPAVGLMAGPDVHGVPLHGSSRYGQDFSSGDPDVRPTSPSMMLDASSRLIHVGGDGVADASDCQDASAVAVPPPKEEALAAFAARVPWAAKFANANLEMPLWAGEDAELGANRKQDVEGLLQEIAKLTDSADEPRHDASLGASSWPCDEATLAEAPGGCERTNREPGGEFLTETWGDAIAFTASGTGDLAGISQTLQDEDILAAALN